MSWEETSSRHNHTDVVSKDLSNTRATLKLKLWLIGSAAEGS